MRPLSGINEKNRRILDALNRLGEKIFSIEDAAKALRLSSEDASFYLAYFARRGWLSRVKRGLYISVPLGTINPQEYKEKPWIIADRVFSPCYIGGWSAAEYWALTDQIFNSVFVFTGRVFRKKEITVQGTEFVLKLSRTSPGHTKNIWFENTKIQVSDPTQTVVDMLDDPSCAGGVRHVADIVKTYAETEHFNQETLFSYLQEKGNRTAYKRLGFIIETLNLDLPIIIHECRKNISAGYSPLDPLVKGKPSFNRRWNLKINVDLKK